MSTRLYALAARIDGKSSPEPVLVPPHKENYPEKYEFTFL